MGPCVAADLLSALEVATSPAPVEPLPIGGRPGAAGTGLGDLGRRHPEAPALRVHGGNGPNSDRGKAIRADPCWLDGSAIILRLVLDRVEASIQGAAPLSTLLRCVERCSYLVVNAPSALRIGRLIDQLEDPAGRGVLIASWLRAVLSPAARLEAALRWHPRNPDQLQLLSIIAAQADQQTILEIIAEAGPRKRLFWFGALARRGEPWAFHLAAEQVVRQGGSIRWYVLKALRRALGTPSRYPDSGMGIDGAWEILSEHWDQLQYDNTGYWPESDANDHDFQNERYHAIAATDALFCVLGGAWCSGVRELPGLAQRFEALPASSTSFGVPTQEACITLLEDVAWRLGEPAAAWAREQLSAGAAGDM